MKRAALFYILTLTVAVLGILAILHFGADLTRSVSVSVQVTEAPVQATPSFWSNLGSHLHAPLGQLFLQLLVIICIARIIGHVFTRFGQPAVVGEMVAGVLLGPSLFGLMAPDLFHAVFPDTSLGVLKLLSQIGVCLFMFTVGMELDLAHVRGKARSAVMVSHASIVAPYLLGVILAYFLFEDLAAHGTGFTAFALFMGISMSITAFPVLARILQERGLTKTFLGSTALTCAAVDDVTAWTLLAFVVAIARFTGVASSFYTVLLVLAFVALMIWVVRPALPRLLGKGIAAGEPSKGVLAFIVCIVLASALSTEVIGIHALFGAFLAGTIMPDMDGFRHKLAVRIEDFSSVLLLPLFFAFTGLRTQIGLLGGFNDWLVCLLILLVATTGKLGASALTARWTGMGWRESLQLGALMNTRGLMELIALNIGYDLGILSSRIFTMLVIMALVTTMMTGPLLTLFGGQKQRSEF